MFWTFFTLYNQLNIHCHRDISLNPYVHQKLPGSGDSCFLTQEILFIYLFTGSGTASGGDDKMNIRKERLFLKRDCFLKNFYLFLLNFKQYTESSSLEKI